MRLKGRENEESGFSCLSAEYVWVEALAVNYLMCNQQNRFKFIRLEAYAILSVLFKEKNAKIQTQTY